MDEHRLLECGPQRVHELRAITGRFVIITAKLLGVRYMLDAQHAFAGLDHDGMTWLERTDSFDDP
jgi:hypothetical protein